MRVSARDGVREGARGRRARRTRG